MATTENNYTASGSQTLYSFTFPYIDTTDIKVSVDDVVKTLTTHYTLASATQIQFNTAPSASAKIRIYRDTDTDNKKATFFSGSAIRSQDLNEDFDQVLYSVQEMKGEVADFPTDHWNVTTETLDSSETFVDSESYVMTAAAIQDRIDATSPVLVDTTKVAKAGDTMTGNLIIDNAKEIRFSEPDASGTNYTAFKAQAQGSDITLTLPAAAPGTGKYLKTNDSTATTLEWGEAGVGATGGGDDIVFWVNEQTVDHDYTIPNNQNAGSFGPITVQAGKTVTVGAGEVWTVV